MSRFWEDDALSRKRLLLQANKLLEGENTIHGETSL